MTGAAMVSVARIEPDLARRSWARVRRLVAHDDPGGASDDLRCLIAVFGHGNGVPESIDRVRRVLAAGTPAHVSRHIAVQAALSNEPDRDKPGTLYMNWLFESSTRAPSRYVLPTTRSWVSTTASTRNISHSTAQTARIARRRLSGSSRSPSAK